MFKKAQIQQGVISDFDIAESALIRPNEIRALFALFTFYWLAYSTGEIALLQLMNIVGPVILTFILCWSCFRIARASHAAIWAPLFWFRLACAAYFGVGALVVHIANAETINRIYTLFYFDDEINFKVNLIYISGIFVSLSMSHFLLIFLKKMYRKNKFQSGLSSGDSTVYFGWAYLIFGGFVRYTIAIPYELGLINYVIPGIVITISNVFYAGVYLLARASVSTKKSYKLIVFSIVIVDIIVSVTSFSKAQLVFILIFYFLGIISNFATKKFIFGGSLAVFIAYSTFGPLVTYGRDEISFRYGEIRGAGISERMAIVSRWITENRDVSDRDSQQSFNRVNYLSVNAFAVERYDSGKPGDTFKHAAAVFVPRFLWPGKPIISDLGAELNELVFGRDTSQLGVGHFAEAYWNFGWKGIVPMMAVLAFILTVYSRFSIGVMARKDWLFLPLVLLGVTIGFRVDGHFVVVTLGPAWTAMIIAIPLSAVSGIALAVTSRRRNTNADVQARVPR